MPAVALIITITGLRCHKAHHTGEDPDGCPAVDAGRRAEAGREDGADADADLDTDTDTDNDADADSDSDSDSDADADADADSDAAVKSGNLLWVRSAGSPATLDYGQALAVLQDGSVIITGNFSSRASFGLEDPNATHFWSEGETDIFIAGYDSDGALAWAKRAGGTGADECTGIAPLPDGSSFITGYFNNTASFGKGENNETSLTIEGTYENEDIFIARYNADGTLAWAKNAGGAGDDRGVAVTTMQNGNAVFTGDFSYDAVFGKDEINETFFGLDAGLFNNNVFLAMYAGDGSLVWAKCVKGANVADITSEAGRGIFITGYFDWIAYFAQGEPIETLFTDAGMSTPFLARYNFDGGLEWARRVDTRYTAANPYDGQSKGKNISITPDGTVLLTGQFAGEAVFGPGESEETILVSAGYVPYDQYNSVCTDIFVARYSPDGELIRVWRAGDTTTDKGMGIQSLADGSFLLSGFFSNSLLLGEEQENETTLYSDLIYGTFLAKYDSAFEMIWAITAVENNNIPRTMGMGATKDGSAFLTGDYGWEAWFDRDGPNSKWMLASGTKDIFIARFAP